MGSHNENHMKNSNILKFPNLVLTEYFSYTEDILLIISSQYIPYSNPFFPEKKLTSFVLITKVRLSFTSDLEIQFYFSALTLEGIAGI